MSTYVLIGIHYKCFPLPGRHPERRHPGAEAGEQEGLRGEDEARGAEEQAGEPAHQQPQPEEGRVGPGAPGDLGRGPEAATGKHRK